MISYILYLRFKQLIRFINEIGLFRLLFLLPFIFVLFYAIYSAFKSENYNNLILSAYLLFILSVHLKRKDKKFLILICKNYNTKYLIFFTEYFILFIPIYIILLFTGKFLLLVLSIALLALIPLINISKTFNYKKINIINLSFLPKILYEWIYGLKSSWFILIPVYILSIIFVKYSITMPISAAFFGLYFTSFYLQCEPQNFIELFELPPVKFLFKKICTHVLIYWIIIFPLAIISLIFNTDIWKVSIYILVSITILQINAILLKYSIYRPNMSINNSFIIVFLLFFSILIPFLAPIPIVFLLIYFYKAKNNLKIYLNDYYR